MLERVRSRDDGSAEASQDVKALQGRSELMDDMHDAQ